MKNILLALALVTAPVLANEAQVEETVVRSEEEANKALAAVEVVTTEAAQENAQV